MTLKDYYSDFIYHYIADGHTQTDESEAELKKLINEYVCVQKEYFIYEDTVRAITYVYKNISETNKGFYDYKIWRSDYMRKIESYIKYVIKSKISSNNNEDNSERN